MNGSSQHKRGRSDRIRGWLGWAATATGGVVALAVVGLGCGASAPDYWNDDDEVSGSRSSPAEAPPASYEVQAVEASSAPGGMVERGYGHYEERVAQASLPTSVARPSPPPAAPMASDPVPRVTPAPTRPPTGSGAPTVISLPMTGPESSVSPVGPSPSAPGRAEGGISDIDRLEIFTADVSKLDVALAGGETGDQADQEPEQYQAPAMMLTASSVADVDYRADYLAFISRHPFEASAVGLDVSQRIRLCVRDASGAPVNDAAVTVGLGAAPVQGRTHADGCWDFFPGLYGFQVSGTASLMVRVDQQMGEVPITLPAQGDGQDVILRLPQVTASRPEALDLAFLIDVTGSMEDELRYINQEVASIVRRIQDSAPGVSVRVGAIFYRDRSDQVPLQRIAFTDDVHGFAQAMTQVAASGGGDYPEDLNAGLQAALQELSWSEGNAARALVLIADAPPKRYVDASYTTQRAVIEAAARGIRILPVAASGADRSVEFLFRALGAATSTPYVHLTDHSGVGNPHLTADSTHSTVEYLNDLITRMIIADLRGEGMHAPGFGAVAGYY